MGTRVVVMKRRKSLDRELEWLALGQPRKRRVPSGASRIQSAAVVIMLGWFIGIAVLMYALSAGLIR